MNKLLKIKSIKGINEVLDRITDAMIMKSMHNQNFVCKEILYPLRFTIK